MSKDTRNRHTIVAALGLLAAMLFLFFLIATVPKTSNNEMRAATLYRAWLIFSWIPITCGILAALNLLCIDSFRRKMSSGVRAFLVVVTILSMLPPLNFIFAPFAQSPFDGFWNAVTKSKELGKVISWSQTILRDSDSTEPIQIIPDEKVPQEVKALYPKREGEPEPYISVVVSRELGEDRKMAVVHYSFRDVRFGLFIGSTNLDIPGGKVKKLKKFKDGLFIFGD